MNVGEKIALARASRFPAWSQNDLAQSTGYTRSLIAQWERGLRTPKREAILRVAEALQAPVEWFMNGEAGPPPLPPEASVESGGASLGFSLTAAIRAYRGVLAGYQAEECWFEEDGYEEVPTAFLIGGSSKIDLHGIARVSGRSMEPRIKSSDRVVVYWTTTLVPNSIVLATDPQGRTYLKVLREDGVRGFRLESLSSHGDAFPDLRGWRIHGYAVAILSEDDQPGPNVEWRGGRALRA